MNSLPEEKLPYPWLVPQDDDEDENEEEEEEVEEENSGKNSHPELAAGEACKKNSDCAGAIDSILGEPISSETRCWGGPRQRCYQTETLAKHFEGPSCAG